MRAIKHIAGDVGTEFDAADASQHAHGAGGAIWPDSRETHTALGGCPLAFMS